jgi:hypothetical protein
MNLDIIEKNTEHMVKKMLGGDIALILVLLAAVWGVVLTVLLKVIAITGGTAVRGVLIAVSVIACGTLTWGMTMVIKHLISKKDEIYREDIKYQK